MRTGARECDVAGKAVDADVFGRAGDYVISSALITSGVNTLLRDISRAFAAGIQAGCR